MRQHFELIFNGEYDIPNVTFKRPPIVLDIGANMGAYTVWAKNRFPGCLVYGFEPSKKNYEIALENLEHLELKDLLLYNVAVSSDLSKDILYWSNSNAGAYSLDQQLAGTSSGSEKIKILLPKNLPKADILKADTEGSEVDIIDTYLEKHTPTIISYEWHRTSDGEYLFNLLKAKGYSLKSGTTYSDKRGVYNWLYEKNEKLV